MKTQMSKMCKTNLNHNNFQINKVKTQKPTYSHLKICRTRKRNSTYKQRHYETTRQTSPKYCTVKACDCFSKDAITECFAT